MDLLMKEVKKEYRTNRGYTAIVGLMISIMIAMIIGVQVVLPTLTNAIATGNPNHLYIVNATYNYTGAGAFGGTVGTLLGLVPLLFTVLIVLVIVGAYAVISSGI